MTPRAVLARWFKGRNPKASPALTLAPARAQAERGGAAEYRLLYKYLRDRYADLVVLTFAEIEDLVGFSLPAPARLQLEWWGTAGPIAQRTAQSNAWTLASRTATVNLTAQRVAFERHS